MGASGRSRRADRAPSVRPKPSTAVAAACSASISAGAMERWTRRREVAEQIWPAHTKIPHIAQSTTEATHESSKTSIAPLPPSSSPVRRVRGALALSISRPPRVEPVNER